MIITILIFLTAICILFNVVETNNKLDSIRKTQIKILKIIDRHYDDGK